MLNRPDPVIVGLSVNVPGPAGVRGMWKSLANGICTIGHVDPNLFNPDIYHDPEPGQIGKSYSMHAGQLEDIHALDHAFFGLSARTAAQMDPQQKLMLRATWNAIEDSRLNRAELAGDRTGVFIGASIVENLSLYYYDPARGDSQFMLGNTLNSIASRVSSILDFRGPSHVLDTACASGLYALHQAAEALRNDEIDTAIVGAVHICRTPGGYVGFSQARMLSPTGRCRAFDAQADGYVRAEAAVAIILQRPEKAHTLGARARAIVRSSGINTDGRSSRITIPSMAQQEQLMRAVLERSGIDPADLAFFEAHGTGTAVGDPIEAGSLGRAIGMMRNEPLLIGSSKTNFGHSEPASGLVGLAKTLLAFEHGALPASLHFHTPNPHIDFDQLNLKVNTEFRALQRDKPLLAGVNSFGFGGNNVCVMLEAVQALTQAPVQSRTQPSPGWLLLAAANSDALQEMAGFWADHLNGVAIKDWHNLAAAQARISEFTDRIALPLDEQLPKRLRQVAESQTPDGAIRGHQRHGAALKTVLAFPGNGAQVAHMGRREMEESPLFRRHLKRIAAEFDQQGGPDIYSLMGDPQLETRLSETLIAQSILFAYQVALAKCLIEVGLVPDAVLGHSAGEISALHVAGVLDLADAVRVVRWRAQRLDELSGTGGMAVVGMELKELNRALSLLGEHKLVIAAINSPRSLTISGPHEDVVRLAKLRIDGRRLPVVQLNITIPYHSPLLDSLELDFISELSEIRLHPPRLPLASSVLGRMVESSDLDSTYFWRNTREQVRFSAALASIAAREPTAVIEISPINALGGNCRDLAQHNGLLIQHFSLATNDPTRTDLPHDLVDIILARAWCQGIAVPIERLAGSLPTERPNLPPYPMQHSRHIAPLSADGLDAWSEVSPRHLAGLRADRASFTWSADFTPGKPEWLKQHVVGGEILIPGVAMMEVALSAAREVWPSQPLLLRDLDLVRPVMITDSGQRLRTVIDPVTRNVTLSTRKRLSTDNWVDAARGVTEPLRAAQPSFCRPDRVGELTFSDIPELLRNLGMDHGPAFQRITRLSRGIDGGLLIDLGSSQIGLDFTIDFTALDASFQALIKMVDYQEGAGRSGFALVPTHVARFELWQLGIEVRHAHISLSRLRDHSLVADLTLLDAQQGVVAKATGIEFAAMRLAHNGNIPLTRIVRREVRLRLPNQTVILPESSKLQAACASLGWQAEVPEENRAEHLLQELNRDIALCGDFDDQSAKQLMKLAPELAMDLRDIIAGTSGLSSRYSWTHKALWQALVELVEMLSSLWPDEQRLNLRIFGLPDAGQLTRLVRNEDIDGIQIAHFNSVLHDSMLQTLPPSLRPLLGSSTDQNNGAHDLVVDISGQQMNTLPNSLANGGLYVALDFPGLHPTPEACPPPDVTLHLANSPLPMRLRLWRKPVAESQPVPVQLRPSRNLYSAQPSRFRPWLPDYFWAEVLGGLNLAGTPAEASHLLIVHVHNGLQPIEAELTGLVQRLRKSLDRAEAPLVVICLDLSPPDGSFEIVRSAIGAAMRCLVNEMPERRHGLLSLRQVPEAIDDDELMHWCDAALMHGEAVMSEGSLSTPIFVPDLEENDLNVANANGTHRLVQAERGNLSTITWQPTVLDTPSAGEVEIEVLASGLNFRDVMLARGLLPERLLDMGQSGAGLGMECAGIIRKVGQGCEGIEAGTYVMALATGALSSRVILPARTLMKVPPGIPPIHAAALPVAFLTAWHALHDIGRVQPGEHVLIHGGAGGVGLAAIQIARMAGCQVHATAASPERRAIARAFGAQYLHASRDLSFVDGIMECTAGKGVDVVLNSLSGEAMRQSLNCLAPFGRFLELGKRDFVEGNSIDLRPFLNNLSYHGIDLDQFTAHRPDCVVRIMNQVSDAFAEGRLHGLPVSLYPACDVQQAFTDMLAARHLGKILIAPPSSPSPAALPNNPVRGAWLILGGTGGIGLALARRLLAEGASHVHLISRSGRMALADQAENGWIEGDNRVMMHAVDARDASALGLLMDKIEDDGAVIGGVIHAAMVLRDQMMRDLDTSQFTQVLAAKLGVARTLDSILRARRREPDHVVFLSSVVSAIANVGQTSYAMANAAIEALAERRRADGLPGLALGWGPVSGSGHLHRDTLLAARLSRIDGIAFITIEQLCDSVINAVRSGRNRGFSLAAINWDRLADTLPVLDKPAFARLVAAERARRVPTADLISQLRSASPGQAVEILRDEIMSILASILRSPRSSLDINLPMASYGLDSLMAMELRLEAERRFGRNLPMSMMSASTSPAQLTNHLLRSLRTDFARDDDHPGEDERATQ